MIDLEEAQARLRTLAADRPDYVYERPISGGCVYFGPDNTPSCIVGHALEHELRAAGIDQAHDDNTLGIRYLSELPVAPLARDYLAHVQNDQDRGVPWGEAVEIADKLVAHEAL